LAPASRTALSPGCRGRKVERQHHGAAESRSEHNFASDRHVALALAKLVETTDSAVPSSPHKSARIACSTIRQSHAPLTLGSGHEKRADIHKAFLAWPALSFVGVFFKRISLGVLRDRAGDPAGNQRHNEGRRPSGRLILETHYAIFLMIRSAHCTAAAIIASVRGLGLESKRSSAVFDGPLGLTP
jgi:hypothetical protein